MIRVVAIGPVALVIQAGDRRQRQVGRREPASRAAAFAAALAVLTTSQA